MRPPSARATKAIRAMQARVQRDEGGRGIAALVRPDQLLTAAQTLLQPPPSATRGGVLLLTGFPCLRERTPPVESDGPPGAVTLACTLLALGCTPVTMLIEDHSAKVLQSCADAVGASGAAVAAFPTQDRWSTADEARLDALLDGASSVLSIERAGDSADGTCYTMRGLPMGPSLMGRINQVAMPGRGVRTIGIGDGGNELGMGSLHDDIVRSIPLGGQIGCVVPSDAPLIASVSNWGGYALSCALAVLAWDTAWDSGMRRQGMSAAAGASDSGGQFLRNLVPDSAAARRTLLACSEAGAMDGITGAGGGSVDGMALEVHLEVLEELRVIALDGMS